MANGGQSAVRHPLSAIRYSPDSTARQIVPLVAGRIWCALELPEGKRGSWLTLEASADLSIFPASGLSVRLVRVGSVLQQRTSTSSTVVSRLVVWSTSRLVTRLWGNCLTIGLTDYLTG